MQIRLLPCEPHASILFSYSFGDLPDGISNPPSWTAQMNQLLRDGLEIPISRSIHCLDRAVGITTLLEEVTFDLANRTISCRFVDDAVESWPLLSTKCIKTLESIVYDVEEATNNDQRKKQEALERDGTRNTDKFSVPIARHKRHRSFLMTMLSSVGSIINLTSSARPSSILPSPPPTPITGFPPRSPHNPRALRRKARSGLVDTFRLCVISELSRRFPPGGYYTWIIQSLLRRASERVSELVRLAQTTAPTCRPFIRQPPREADNFCPTTMNVPSLFSDDEDDDGSGETDTDWSSVHTPTSSHFSSFRNVPYSSNPDVRYQQHLEKCIESLKYQLSRDNLAEYRHLCQMRARLYRLLNCANNQVTQLAVEQKHRLAVLEVRSRRRAWSNNTLAGADAKDYGLATPMRSSPLAHTSWSGEDFEYAPEPVFEVLEEDEGEQLGEMFGPTSRRKRTLSGPKLFPVSEEEDDDDDDDYDDDERELEIEMGLDLEGGMRYMDEEDEDDDLETGMRVAFEIERPQLYPRRRTASMHPHRLNFPIHVEAGSVPHSPPRQLSASSLLYQPISSKSPQQVPLRIEKPPVYTELNVSISELEVSGYGNFGKYASVGDEFTLAMDLPRKMRVQDKNIIHGRQGFSVGIVNSSRCGFEQC